MTIEELKEEFTPLHRDGESVFESDYRVRATQYGRNALFLPLLAVAEAAENEVAKCEPCKGTGVLPYYTTRPSSKDVPCRTCLALRTALADFDKAREAM